jgi:hypothetical protein
MARLLRRSSAARFASTTRVFLVYLLYWYTRYQFTCFTGTRVAAPVFSCEAREHHTGVFSLPALRAQKYRY